AVEVGELEELGRKPLQFSLQQLERSLRQLAVLEAAQTADARELGRDEFADDAPAVNGMDRPARMQPQQVRHLQPDAILRQQVDQAQPVQPDQQPRELGSRDLVACDDIARFPVAQQQVKDAQQL